jgi:hypothetical protein
MQRIFILTMATALLAGCTTYDNGYQGGVGSDTQIDVGGGYSATTPAPEPIVSASPAPGNALDIGNASSGMTQAPGAPRPKYQ